MAERQRETQRRAEMARRAASYAAEQAVFAERGAKFRATHERQRKEPGPRGTEPLIAHAGGTMTTNKEEALRKFAARKGDAVGERAKAMSRQLEERRAEEEKAKQAAQAAEQAEERKRKRRAEAIQQVNKRPRASWRGILGTNGGEAASEHTKQQLR